MPKDIGEKTFPKAGEVPPFSTIRNLTGNQNFGGELGRDFKSVKRTFSQASEAALIAYEIVFITKAHELATAPQSYREVQLTDIEIQAQTMINPDIPQSTRQMALENLLQYKDGQDKYYHEARVIAFDVLHEYSSRGECPPEFTSRINDAIFPSE